LRTCALKYLARREYSRNELRGKLQKQVRSDASDEFDSGESQPAIVEAILDDLAARGWLSDERAARQLIHAKRSRFGMQRITHELRRKGIAENLIGEVLPKLKETELAAAQEVWLKKFGTPALDQKEKAKQLRFLQSRGFSMEVIRTVLRDTDPEESPIQA